MTFDIPETAVVSIVIGAIAFWGRDLWDRFRGTERAAQKFVTRDECIQNRNACGVTRNHDSEEIKAWLGKVSEKVDCIDRKLAKISGFLEARKNLESGVKDEN
jgi:hypothetical protein